MKIERRQAIRSGEIVEVESGDEDISDDKPKLSTVELTRRSQAGSSFRVFALIMLQSLLTNITNSLHQHMQCRFFRFFPELLKYPDIVAIIPSSNRSPTPASPHMNTPSGVQPPSISGNRCEQAHFVEH